MQLVTGVDEMIESNVRTKLNELAKRANTIKKDINIRHIPTTNDQRIATENAYLMQPHQYQSISNEESITS
jgi:hypothetical protein